MTTTTNRPLSPNDLYATNQTRLAAGMTEIVDLFNEISSEAQRLGIRCWQGCAHEASGFTSASLGFQFSAVVVLAADGEMQVTDGARRDEIVALMEQYRDRMLALRW